MEALLISTAVCAAFMLLLRFVAQPLKPRFRIEQRISTQALLYRIAFMANACATTERGYGVSARSVKRSIKQNIKLFERRRTDDGAVIPPDTVPMLKAVYDRLKDRSRLCLKQGHIGKYPRLFLLCDTIVKNTRGCIPPSLLERAVSTFTPLTAGEKEELFDVLIFCLAGLACTALDDYFKRMRDYESGMTDGEAGRVDLDRLRNTDYICGQFAAADGDARGLYTLADNNGIDVEAALRSGSIHAAETAEILYSAISAIEYALGEIAAKGDKRDFSRSVPVSAARVLKISAVVMTAVTVIISAVFCDKPFIAPIMLSTGIAYTAYVKLLRIFGIERGYFPPINDRYIAAMQGVIVIFCAAAFSPVALVLAASTMICEAWAGLYFAGENGSLAPLKSIPKAAAEFVAVPSRVVRPRKRYAHLILQASYAAVIIVLNAFFSASPILYVIGALAALEPFSEDAVKRISKVKSKMREKTAARNVARSKIPSRTFGNMTFSRSCDGKIIVNRRGKNHELNYTVDSELGALSLSKSRVAAFSHKSVYFANSAALETAVEAIAPPTHDCLAMRMSVVNRTPKAANIDFAVTCASEISEDFIGLYIDGEEPDFSERKVLRVEKSATVEAFGKRSFTSVLAFGKTADRIMDVVSSDGYFEAGEAAALCCRKSADSPVATAADIPKPRLPRKNILCGGKVFADVSDSGVIGGTFPRAYVIVSDASCADKNWSLTLYPCGYNNRALHYNGFSRFICDHNGIKCTLDIFAVRGIDALAYRLRLKNMSDAQAHIGVSFVCELPDKNRIGAVYMNNGATVTIKDGDGFFISSTEKTERSKYSNNPLTPAVCADMRLNCDDERTVGFFLSRGTFVTADIDGSFDETVGHYRKTPVQPLTTDKMLDYAFNRALYRVKCAFCAEEISDAFACLMLCRAYKYVDTDAVEKRIIEVCPRTKSLTAPKRLIVPLAVDDFIKHVGKSDILNADGVANSVSSALESVYGYIVGGALGGGAIAAAFCYCVDVFRECISAEQRLRYRNIKTYCSESTLTALCRLSGNREAYNASRLYDGGDRDGGYAAVSALKDAATDFEDDGVNAALFFALVAERLFGIERRGEIMRISPGASLGTPHMEFIMSERGKSTHIVVADGGTTDGSWFTKIGNVVYATNAVAVADYPSPVILFRRQ